MKQNGEMMIEEWPLERLREYERNPRQNDHAVERVAAAIKEKMSAQIIKTAGKAGGKIIGHCYDGPGWNECSFWKRTGKPEESRCMLFGGDNGVGKYASESLRICDKIYGVDYTGDV